MVNRQVLGLLIADIHDLYFAWSMLLGIFFPSVG
jgi:hypothetical protein